MVIAGYIKKAHYWLGVTIVFSIVVSNVLSTKKSVSAAYLLNRSVNISTPLPSTTSEHNYNFVLQSAVTIGSIAFEYCANSPLFEDVCTAPTGLSVSSSSLSTQSGETGFTMYSTSANKVVIGRTPAAITPPVSANYLFNNITNPSENMKTFYVRISTYSSNDGTGRRDEIGAVAFSTSTGFDVEGFVPPYLTFCVGVTVSSDCTSTTGNYLSFGELSSTSTKSLASQFAVATNDPVGYVVSLSGVTMTSGNNTIDKMELPMFSNTGVSQFGINLRANTSPLIGLDKSGSGTGFVSSDFNLVDQFVFKNDNIAFSTIPSDFNVYTISYIVNIPNEQPPGIYTSTITYIATVQF